MSKKHLLNKTKKDFIAHMRTVDDSRWYEAVTTPLNANTQYGRFRRLYIKMLNDQNYKHLKTGKML